MLKFIILLLLLLTLVFQLNAQNYDNRRYKCELKRFMRFMRDTEFENTDTLICRNYLCNKQMFGGIVLVGHGVYGFSDAEKKELIAHTSYNTDDTGRLYINKKLMRRTKLVADAAKNYWEFSKPVFLRDYLLCVFSYGGRFNPNNDQQFTFLYKKEKGRWSKLFEIGAIKNY